MNPACTRKIAVYLFAALVAVTFSLATHAADQYPTLEMHGWHYANACSDSEQKRLRKSIFGIVKDAPKVWRAVKAILCAPRTGPERAYLASVFPKKVRTKSEETGQEPSFETIERSESLIDGAMAAGEAWSAGVQVRYDNVTIKYFANEACVRSVTLSYHQAKWLVDIVGEACD